MKQIKWEINWKHSKKPWQIRDRMSCKFTGDTNKRLHIKSFYEYGNAHKTVYNWGTKLWISWWSKSNALSIKRPPIPEFLLLDWNTDNNTIVKFTSTIKWHHIRAISWQILLKFRQHFPTEKRHYLATVTHSTGQSEHKLGSVHSSSDHLNTFPQEYLRFCINAHLLTTELYLTG